MKVNNTKHVKESKQFELINPHAAGIDIGSRSHYVCVGKSKDAQPIRKFDCFTPDLHKLADWLIQCGITTVAMESTGVYWIPVFQILESQGLEVILVNARHVKTSPAKKQMCRIASGFSSYTHTVYYRDRSGQMLIYVL